jgi:hypothetical protein
VKPSVRKSKSLRREKQKREREKQALVEKVVKRGKR